MGAETKKRTRKHREKIKTTEKPTAYVAFIPDKYIKPPQRKILVDCGFLTINSLVNLLTKDGGVHEMFYLDQIGRETIRGIFDYLITHNVISAETITRSPIDRSYDEGLLDVLDNEVLRVLGFSDETILRAKMKKRHAQ